MKLYSDFISQPFFSIFPDNKTQGKSSVSGHCSPPPSPCCEALRSQLQSLRIEKETLHEKCKNFENLLTKEQTQCLTLSALVSDKNTKINELEKKIVQGQRSLAGIKSGVSRSKAKQATAESEAHATEVKCSHDKFGLGFIAITSENDSRIFEGIRYFGSQSGRSMETSGKKSIYVSFQSSKTNSEISDKQLSERCSFLFTLCCLLSGFSFQQVSVGSFNLDVVKPLISKFVRSFRHVFTDSVLKSAGLNILRSITPAEGVTIQTILRLPHNSMRTIRIMFNNLGFRQFFPSEREMRKEQACMLDHLKDVETVVTAETMRLLGDPPYKYGDVFVLRCKDLVKFIEGIVRDHEQKSIIGPDQLQSEISLLFGGDKGGKYMKFHFEVIFGQDCISVHDVHPFALHSGSDCIENMAIVLAPFFEAFQTLQSNSFKIFDHPVKVLFGGDFHYLDDLLGHQGSSATYPSSKWDVTSEHLTNHGGKGHSPNSEFCKDIKRRTISDIQSLVMENIVDDRKGNERKTGRHHGNFHHGMLIPIRSLDSVVPPVLHIMLGVVLKLYEFLLAQCQKIDEPQVDGAKQKKRRNMNDEWQNESTYLQYIAQQKTEIGSSYLDLFNHRERIDEAL